MPAKGCQLDGVAAVIGSGGIKVTRRNKLLILFTAIPLLLLAVVLLYLNLTDFSEWRDTVSEILSESMGRELRFEGIFEADVGLTTRVEICDIRLANADWSSNATMATIDRFALEFDLLSVFSGPIRIHSLELDGADILLEVSADGLGNWEFGSEDEVGDGEPLDLRLGRSAVNHLQLRYHDAASEDSLDIGLTRFESAGDDSDMHELSANGLFEDLDFEIAGRLGTLSGFLNASAIETISPDIWARSSSKARAGLRI